MAGTHLRFAASKAATWVNCIGALPLQAVTGTPDGPPSEAAASGTCSHYIAHQVLIGAPIASFLGTWQEHDGFRFKIDQERLDRVQQYVDYVRALPGDKEYEVALSLMDDVGGTADCLSAAVDELHIVDFKDGHGFVEANTEQLLVYLIAARNLYSALYGDFLKYTAHIVQPKVGKPRSVTYTNEDLDAFEAKVYAAANAARACLEHPGTNLTDLLTPGDKQCKWCPMRGSCPARAAMVAAKFPDMTQQALKPHQLTELELADWLDRRPAIEAFFNDIAAQALHRAQLGAPIPRYKLAEGRQGNRAWDNIEIVEGVLNKELAGDAYERKLIGPAPAEKKLKAKNPEAWAKLLTHIVRSPGQPTLVPEGDFRPPMVANMPEFENIDITQLIGV